VVPVQEILVGLVVVDPGRRHPVVRGLRGKEILVEGLMGILQLQEEVADEVVEVNHREVR
jgi:hypothetical protein